MATDFHAPPATSNTAAPSKMPRALRAFWAAMLQSFGTRWTESYGLEPPLLWVQAFTELTKGKVRTATKRILRSGSGHPPTLPEALAYARNQPAYTAPVQFAS